MAGPARVNIHLKRPQIHLGGNAGEVAQTFSGIAGASRASEVNILIEDAEIYVGAAPRQQQQQQQQLQYDDHEYDGTILAGSRMSPDPPSFEPSFTAGGLDFRCELAQRRYYCHKHVDEKFRLILYTQSAASQKVQSFFRVISMGMSAKRAKHVIFMFDTTVDYRSFKWPDRLKLEDVKHKLIKGIIGHDYELCRKKVSKESFSLYLYGVKRRYTSFSRNACLDWALLVYWADSMVGEISGASLTDQLASAPPSMLSNGVAMLRPLLGSL